MFILGPCAIFEGKRAKSLSNLMENQEKHKQEKSDVQAGFFTFFWGLLTNQAEISSFLEIHQSHLVTVKERMEIIFF